MELLSSTNLGVEYLLFAIDVFTKYVWIKPLKNKTSKTVNYGFNEIVIESKCQSNILWVDLVREFHNNLMEKRLNDNNVLRYSTHNEG